VLEGASLTWQNLQASLAMNCGREIVKLIEIRLINDELIGPSALKDCIVALYALSNHYWPSRYKAVEEIRSL
jgi:hypothetical protein